ncbi:TIGR03790 family protein, partial [Candidatus Desantisbacteria bacterium]|nr:TIGR03790 family protein [Candidatus Desantisbacteria bacterium]
MVYNQNQSASFDVAKYYISKRKVPAGNLLGLNIPDSEYISCEEFEKHLPIIQKAVSALKKNNHNPVILLVYGIPIKIGPLTIKRNNQQKELIEQKIKEQKYLVARLTNQLNKLMGISLIIPDSLNETDPTDKSSAALDSELTLLFAESYSKAKWLPNPFLKQFDNFLGIDHIRETTIKVCRLDASTPQLSKRIVDDAIWTENNGLKGTFYIDARGLSTEKKEDAYGQYDEHLRKLYDLIKKKSLIPVVLDNKPALFPENSCPDAALYCGWYSLGKYIDSFKWQR